MNWLTKWVKPTLSNLVLKRSDSSDVRWVKCRSCAEMTYRRELEASLNVCPKCGEHMPLSAILRFTSWFDEGEFELLKLNSVIHDPLKFRDQKRYSDRLREARAKTGFDDAVQVATGRIHANQAVVVAMDFSFMGGSMGLAVGEGFVTAAREAIKRRAALIVVAASGGARMQEGILSLVQMPRCVAATEMVKDEGLPFIVVMSDPMMGGVSASFAMIGDVHIAEPGARIGFAGRRVIEQTVRETLPDDFQTAGYLKAHGLVDRVTARRDQRRELGSLLSCFMHREPKPAISALAAPTSDSSQVQGTAVGNVGGSAWKTAKGAMGGTMGETIRNTAR